MKKFTEDAIKFKMDDTAELYDFEDEKDDNKPDFKKLVGDNWVEPSRRERKRNYSDTDYFKQAMRQGGPAKPKEPRIPRMPQLHDFQFFNTQRLSELYEKEVRFLMQTHQRNQMKDTISDGEEPEDLGDPLSAEEEEEKEQLLEEGFSTWTRRDFNAFIRACEKYGRNDIKNIASEMEGKTEEEVERYAKVFKERYKELNDYDRIIKIIERGEARISRKDEIMKAIGKKLDRYKNPWLELKIQYGQNKGKLYNEECDRFMSHNLESTVTEAAETKSSSSGRVKVMGSQPRMPDCLGKPEAQNNLELAEAEIDGSKLDPISNSSSGKLVEEIERLIMTYSDDEVTQKYKSPKPPMIFTEKTCTSDQKSNSESDSGSSSNGDTSCNNRFEMASQYGELMTRWNLPPLEAHISDADDEEWLFRTKLKQQQQ